MSKPSEDKNRPDRGRDRLLDEAERCFAQKGFAGARTKEIAANVGVNTAMIHYWFGTKERLFFEVIARMIADVMRLVDQVNPHDMSTEEKLEAFLVAYFECMKRHPHFPQLTKMAVGFDAADSFEDTIHRFFHPLLAAGERFIEDGIREGVFRPVDPRHFVLFIYGAVVSHFSEGRFLSMVIGEDALAPQALDRRLDTMIDTVFAALGATRPHRASITPGTISPDAHAGRLKNAH